MHVPSVRAVVYVRPQRDCRLHQVFSKLRSRSQSTTTLRRETTATSRLAQALAQDLHEANEQVRACQGACLFSHSLTVHAAIRRVKVCASDCNGCNTWH